MNLHNFLIFQRQDNFKISRLFPFSIKNSGIFPGVNWLVVIITINIFFMVGYKETVTPQLVSNITTLVLVMVPAYTCSHLSFLVSNVG